jgi:biotin carboxyl carrier protein
METAADVPMAGCMREVTVIIDGTETRVGLVDDRVFTVNGNSHQFDVVRKDSGRLSILIDGNSYDVTMGRGAEGRFESVVNGLLVRGIVENEREKLLRRFASRSVYSHHRLEIHAPMPAMVVRIEVAVGDAISEGQGLLVLEAMKMENEIRAHQSGKVKQIFVRNGEKIDKGALLMLLE